MSKLYLENLMLDAGQAERFYFQISLIRQFELKLLELFSKGEIFGTTHTCAGQEANAVAIMNAIDREIDTVWSNHRCHGHFLAYCGHVTGLFAEILGREAGVCAGRGGSQHLSWRNFHSSGIQGGLVPLAVGTAYAERDNGALSVVFLGDGTMGEGMVYEGLNLASLWDAPVLFVIEDNGIAQTTDKHLGVSGSIASRAEPFGIKSASIKSTEVSEVFEIAEEAVGYVRGEKKPFWLHIETTRLGPHSKGDDTRPDDFIDDLRLRDCLTLAKSKISNADQLDNSAADLLSVCLQEAKASKIAMGHEKTIARG